MQRFVHVAALLPRWRGYSRALPLRWVPVFPPQAVLGAATPHKEREAVWAELRWLRTQLDSTFRRAGSCLGASAIAHRPSSAASGRL